MESHLNQIRAQSEHILWRFAALKEKTHSTDQPVWLTSPFKAPSPQQVKHLWVRVNHFKQRGSFQSSHKHALPHKSETGLKRLSLAAGEGDCAREPVGTCCPATGGPVVSLWFLRLDSFLNLSSKVNRGDFTSTLCKQKSLKKTNRLPSSSCFHPLIPPHCRWRTSGIVATRDLLVHEASSVPPLRWGPPAWTEPLFTWLRHLLSGRNNTSGAFSRWQELEGYLSEGAFNVLVQTNETGEGCDS